MNIPSASAGRATVVADERVGTRLQAGGALFAKLMHQLEKSLDALDSFRSAKETDKGRPASGPDSSTLEPGRANGIDGNARNVPTARTDTRAVTFRVGLEASGKYANVNESATRRSPLGDYGCGRSALLPERDGTPGSETRQVDRLGAEAARMGVAAQAQPAISSASFLACDASLQGDAGAQQGAAAGSPAVATAKSVLRHSFEAANGPVISSTSVPMQGTSIAIGLPRTNAQEVEELRSRIAGEMARSGLTNYRLTINGTDMKRVTPAGGHHGDR